ncbi:MAG: hemerythrin family protein [Ignavibacteriales bacterium]|nr:Bacteriohemerythrin [Ignavibacteriaceae bacterium]MCK6615134.1 bacteriohemerythrin [Ignavibacteriaceae bacterium]QOJ28486.1 MAG: hemerythrin family protein [Ignavibacteriales bacterium]
MALVEWKNAYSTNIEVVDNQHKRLVGFVNEMHEAILMGKGQAVMGTILNNLVEYTVYHFSTEEKFFDEYNYPDAELHKKQHRDLVEQVSAIKAKFDAGEKVLTLDVMNFLRDWLHDHILGSDVHFGPFLNSKGVH